MLCGCGCGGYHESDMSWVINFIKEFRTEQENDFQIALEKYMEKYFNSILINAMYDETQKKIYFYKGVKA